MIAAPIGNPLRVVVLEDEWVARNFLVELIEASGIAQVVGAVGDLDEVNDLLNGAMNVDAVFVDINLAGSRDTGMSLVRAWSKRPDAPQFVLATALKEHAIEAFELGVVDYVTKPFSQPRVTQCLERLAAQRAPLTKGPDRVVARRRKSLVFLPVEEIWAFEAAERLTIVHTAHGTLDIDLSLSTIELSFGRRFLRVHRNWLVNASHIRELDRDSGETTVVVGAGYGENDPAIRVPVARERAQALRDQLLAGIPGIRRR